MQSINQRVTVDRTHQPFTALFEACSITYGIELEKDEAETLLIGERIIAGRPEMVSLADRLSIENRPALGIRKLVYDTDNPTFIYITLSAMSLSEINFAKITSLIGDHLDYCKAAKFLLGEPA